MAALAILGTLWALPHTLIGALMMLVPTWRHPDKGWVLFPYIPRKARVHNWTIHFIAGCMIPPGMGPDFRTGAQTHGSLIWFSNEFQWSRSTLVSHEERHSRQEWVFGPLYMPLYGGAFLINLLRFKNTVKAYEQIPFEIDARKHETP